MKISIGMFVAVVAVMTHAAQDDAVKAELDKLQGTWQLVSAETDGKKTDAKQVAQIRVRIEGSKHTVMFGDKVAVKDISFTIDASKTPKTVDDQLPDGKVIRGIYKVDGDKLTSCVGGIDKDRPTEFTAKAGSGQTLRVFKRIEK